MALFSKPDPQHFLFSLNKLDLLGIKVLQIRKAIESDDGKIAVSERELRSLLDKQKNPRISQVVETALAKYYRVWTESREPYYRKFANKGRKFPIPK